MNCKIWIPSQVTTVMLTSTTGCSKSAPRGSVAREMGGNLGCREKPPLGRLADGQAGRNGNRVPWFFTITPLCGTIGFGINIHHFWTWGKSGGREALEQTDQPNMDHRGVGALFVYSDQRSSSLFQTFFCLMRNYLFFLLLLLVFIFCRNQTCCLSRVCCTCDSWGRGTLTNKRCQLC